MIGIVTIMLSMSTMRLRLLLDAEYMGISHNPQVIIYAGVGVPHVTWNPATYQNMI